MATARHEEIEYRDLVERKVLDREFGSFREYHNAMNPSHFKAEREMWNQ